MLTILFSLSCGDSTEQKANRIPEGNATADFSFELAGLPPQLRKDLKSINVLVIRDSNPNDVWVLSEKPQSVDFVILACSAESLSTDIVTLLKTWSGQGHGILVTRSAFGAVWPHFFPSGYLPAFDRSVEHLTPVEGNLITANVSRVRNFLWCSAQGNYLEVVKAEDIDSPYYNHRELSHISLSQLLKGHRERFYPLIVQDNGDGRGEGYRPLVLFVTTWRGSRIAWLAADLEDEDADRCGLLADDARLWSNLSHWLAVR